MAASGSDAAHQTDIASYEVAMKCFVAYGAATGERRDAGDQVAAATYEKKARRSFDVAVLLGDRIGYSGGRQNQDFGLAQTRELPKMVADAAYLRRALATCESAGF